MSFFVIEIGIRVWKNRLSLGMMIDKVEFRWIDRNVKRKKQHYILNFFAHVLYDYPRITYIVNRMIDRTQI